MSKSFSSNYAIDIKDIKKRLPYLALAILDPCISLLEYDNKYEEAMDWCRKNTVGAFFCSWSSNMECLEFNFEKKDDALLFKLRF